jgi:hypothetical protein
MQNFKLSAPDTRRQKWKQREGKNKDLLGGTTMTIQQVVRNTT